MPGRPEHKFQEVAVVFLRRALPGAAVWSVDNGVEGDPNDPRTPMAKIKRLKRGVEPGQPDIDVLTNRPRCIVRTIRDEDCVFQEGTTYIGFECKAKDGSLSDAQLARRDEILRNGGFWFSVRTIEQIEAALVSLGFTLACRTGAVGVAVPQVGKRRLANYARLNEPVPNMRPKPRGSPR